jgi:hypothetical protein
MYWLCGGDGGYGDLAEVVGECGILVEVVELGYCLADSEFG